MPLTEQQSIDLLPRFREDYIEMIEIDRLVGERAHDLCRSFPNNHQNRTLKPGDAIHIAAAEKAGCDVILATDPGLLELKYTLIPIEQPKPVALKSVTALEETTMGSLFPEESQN